MRSRQEIDHAVVDGTDERNKRDRCWSMLEVYASWEADRTDHF
jgi:hypothetical protein